MDDALAVGLVQSVGDLDGLAQQLVGRQAEAGSSLQGHSAGILSDRIE
jgi:hypothetical protein